MPASPLSRTTRAAAGLTGALALVLLGACAPADSGTTATGGSSSSATASGSASASASATADACAKDSLKTLTPGKFTFATDQPVYQPWFVDNKPENGKGFEGAVAAAVAKQLGYSPDEVVWTRVPFNAAIAPGPKKFDADINEFSITDERKKAVDFSSPYYDVTQAVIALDKSKAAGATDIAGLQGLKIGAQVGTTSYDAIVNQIKPSSKPAVFNTNDDAVKALQNGQIDALVTDLPTAFYVTAAQVQGSKIVGQLPAGSGTPEQFGMVLDKGSALTDCVSKAVDAIKADGTLDAITKQWLTADAGAPVLK
ncbi:MAG: ABC transporter substrate-binding protein [Motilibacteraceae bacterium]